MRSFGWLVMGLTVGALGLAGIGCDGDDGDGTGGGGGGTTTTTTATTTTTTDTGEGGSGGGAGGAGGSGGSMGALYNFRLTGTGFGPHDGQLVTVRIQDVESMEVWQLTAATVAGGTFTIDGTGVLMEGQAYTVGFWAELAASANTECDKDVDHTWQEDVAAVSADVEITFAHGAPFDADCLPAPQ